MGFPGGSDGKESICNEGDLSSAPELGRSPGGGHGNPLQDSCLKNPHERSLMGYSPQGHKESDTTEQLSTAQCVNQCRFVIQAKMGSQMICLKFGPERISTTVVSEGHLRGARAACSPLLAGSDTLWIHPRLGSCFPRVYL